MKLLLAADPAAAQAMATLGADFEFHDVDPEDAQQLAACGRPGRGDQETARRAEPDAGRRRCASGLQRRSAARFPTRSSTRSWRGCRSIRCGRRLRRGCRASMLATPRGSRRVSRVQSPGSSNRSVSRTDAPSTRAARIAPAELDSR